MSTLVPAVATPFPDVGHGPYRLLRGFQAGLVRTFDGTLVEPEAAQAARLRVVVAQAVGTAFGREHELRPGETLESWRRLPVRTHADFLPWLDRVAAGEPDVLTHAPVRSLLETSGTTGRPKWLPVTDPWAESVADAQRLWVLGLLRDDEALAHGKALSIVSAAEHARSPGGLPIGANTGRMFLAQPWWVRWRAPIRYPIFTLPDPELRAYTILRHSLGQDIRSWTTANPSTILAYLRRLRAGWEDLRADAADGTLRRGPAAALSAADRRRFGRGLRRVQLPEEPTLPWPLRRINCWTGGPAPFFVARLPEALGRPIPVREVGVTASEGFFAVPVDDGDPVAWLAGHVLELVDAAGVARWPWEAEVGAEYRLVISTEAGLYRYDLGDVVQVTGFCGRAPRLRFLRKVGNVLDSVGERVTEAQVAEAARAAFPTATAVSATLAWGEVPHLRVAVTAAGGDFDAALRRLNVEYDGKRATGRIGPPEVRVVDETRFVAWRAARVAAGAPDAQVKDPVVLSPERWAELVGA